MIGIICFLIVVVLANILIYYVTSPMYRSGVSFINDNFWLLLLIAVILMIADLFGALPFPLNLPAPIIKATGSVFCIAFFLRVLQWVDLTGGTNLYQAFWLVSFLIIPFVFLVVLASGYFEILRRLWWQPKPDGFTQVESVHQEFVSNPDKMISDAKSWEDIGSEFRLVLYDIIHRFRQEIKKKQ